MTACWFCLPWSRLHTCVVLSPACAVEGLATSLRVTGHLRQCPRTLMWVLNVYNSHSSEKASLKDVSDRNVKNKTKHSVVPPKLCCFPHRHRDPLRWRSNTDAKKTKYFLGNIVREWMGSLLRAVEREDSEERDQGEEERSKDTQPVFCC